MMINRLDSIQLHAYELQRLLETVVVEYWLRPKQQQCELKLSPQIIFSQTELATAKIDQSGKFM